MGDSTIDWFFMRPIMAGKTTHTEIIEYLSLCDILDFHEAMDITEEMDHHINKPRN